MAIFGQVSLPATGEGSAGALVQYVYFTGGQIDEAGTLDSVTIRVAGNDSAADVYIGVYKGGSDTTIEGATLIASTANITEIIGGTLTTKTYNFTSGDKTFANGDRLWLAVLIASNADRFNWNVCTDLGDWGLAPDSQNWGYLDSTTATLPATAGTDTGYNTNTLAAYVTYTPGGASIVPHAMAGYRMRTA